MRAVSEIVDVRESTATPHPTSKPTAVIEAGLQDRLKVFALHSAQGYAEHIAGHLGVRLAQHEEYFHPDQESYIRSLENVRRARVFVIADLYSDRSQTVDQKLMKLIWFVGSLRDASADDITVVSPYLAYARSDRKVKSREGVLTKYLAEMLEAVGVNRILTMDVHNLGAFQNAYRHVKVDNLEAKNVFAEFMAKELSGITPDDVSVLAPDPGGLGRARRFRRTLNSLMEGEVKIAFLDKERNGKKVSGENIIGEVAPVTIIVDDMISSGNTVQLAVDPIRHRGGEQIYVVATHGLFVGNANENLANPALYKIVIADSIVPFRLDREILKKTAIIDTTSLFAQAIHNTYTGQSLSRLFE